MTSRTPGPGDVLGDRYELGPELGRGGMATVYRATDLRLQRPVAVKVFREGVADAVDPRRTAQEMQLLAGVNHPAVVAVLDAANGDGSFGTWLVMELVEGVNLGRMLADRRGPLGDDLARRVIGDVAAALAMLHGQGVVHRDVKPANILVVAGAETRQDGVAAKLTDFGIAQMVDGARITAPESILGTAAYLSPEQVRGARLRPASDVYSLGLVLLEALTGDRVFPGTAAEAAMARLHRPPTLPPHASPALAELLSRMTAQDPAARPRASEVAEALHTRLVGTFTAPEAAVTAPTPMQGVPVLTGPSMVLGDATAPHLLGRGSPFPEPTADGATAPRRRFPTALAVTAAALAAAAAGLAISAAAGVQAPSAGNAAVGAGGGAPHSAAAPASSAAASRAVVDPVRAVPSTPAGGRSTASASATPSGSASASATPSATPTVSVPVTPSASTTPSPDPSATPSSTPSDTPTPSDQASDDPTPSALATSSDGVLVVAAG